MSGRQCDGFEQLALRAVTGQACRPPLRVPDIACGIDDSTIRIFARLGEINGQSCFGNGPAVHIQIYSQNLLGRGVCVIGIFAIWGKTDRIWDGQAGD